MVKNSVSQFSLLRKHTLWNSVDNHEIYVSIPTEIYVCEYPALIGYWSQWCKDQSCENVTNILSYLISNPVRSNIRCN